jgi:hypothetical protein
MIDKKLKHNSSDKEKDVHTEHCCKYCGCKYGEDDFCPVVNGRKSQSFSCEELRY